MNKYETDLTVHIFKYILYTLQLAIVGNYEAGGGGEECSTGDQLAVDCTLMNQDSCPFEPLLSVDSAILEWVTVLCIFRSSCGQF